MKKNNSLFAVLTIMLSVFCQQTFSQNILEWNFNTPTASTGREATFTATLNKIGLETSILTRGSGAPSGGGCGSGFVGALTVSADKAAAIANNAYYEFKIQPKDGYYLTPTAIKANIRIQTYAAKTYQWMYSLDGGNTFNEIGSPVTPDVSEVDVNNGVMQPTIDLSGIAELKNLSAYTRVTFRLYAWGGTTPAAGSESYINFGFGKSTSSIPSIAIEGDVVDYISNAYAWNFYGSKGTETQYYCTSRNYNLELANLTRGAGAPGTNGNGNGFSANLTVSSTLEEAETNQTYFEFSLKPNSGASASLSGINSNIRTQTYSAKTYQWKYSVNGGAFIAIGSPVTVDPTEVNVNNGVEQALIDLSGISDLQNIPSTSIVTFRLYAWGGSTPAVDAADKTNVNFGFGKSTTTTPSLTINGTVLGDVPQTSSIISAWEFSTVGNSSTANPSPINGSFNATTKDANIQSSVISRGAGLVVVGLFYSYAATSPVSSSKQYAIDNSLYFQTVLTPLSNIKVSLSGLRFKFRRNGSGPTNYFWRYSTDGTNFIELYNGVFTSTDTNGELMPPLDLSSINELQNIQSAITLRLYVWGVTDAAAVFAVGRYASGDTSNSLAIYGNTESVITTSLENINKNDIWIDGEQGSTYLNINHEILGSAHVKVVDLSGRILFNKTLKNDMGFNKVLLPKNLKSGIYLLSFTENEKVQNMKFIIK